jgi:hypothetical protein
MGNHIRVINRLSIYFCEKNRKYQVKNTVDGSVPEFTHLGGVDGAIHYCNTHRGRKRSGKTETETRPNRKSGAINNSQSGSGSIQDD